MRAGPRLTSRLRTGVEDAEVWLEVSKSGKLEATPGIEPGYADLQSDASPLRHVASLITSSPGGATEGRVAHGHAYAKRPERTSALSPAKPRGPQWIWKRPDLP